MNCKIDNRQRLVEHITQQQGAFYRLAYSYVKNPDDAMDVVQEAVVKSLANIDRLREPAYLKTWFYRILLNECMNHFRKTKNLFPLNEELAVQPVPGREPFERLDLYYAIDRLTLEEQTIIRLRFFEDLKLEEISRATGIKLNTVKTKLYKALKKLRELTGEEIPDEP